MTFSHYRSSLLLPRSTLLAVIVCQKDSESFSYTTRADQEPQSETRCVTLIRSAGELILEDNSTLVDRLANLL